MYPKKRKNDNNNSDDINGKFLMHKPFKEIEDDNPRQFDQVLCKSVNVKNASLIGPELQCPQVYYFLQKGSE